MALSDLASAIASIHNFFVPEINLKLIGIHNDIRPPNILLFKDTLVLADFGSAEFCEEQDLPVVPPPFLGIEYSAPESEYEDGNFKGTANPSSDIWSFGCILAEALTYVMLGSRGIQEFRKMRRFQSSNIQYRAFHDLCGGINPNVFQWLRSLENRSTYTHKMLLILVRRMLAEDASMRPKAEHVSTALSFIALHQAVEDLSQWYNWAADTETLQGPLFGRQRFLDIERSIRSIDVENFLGPKGCSVAFPNAQLKDQYAFLVEIRKTLSSIIPADSRSGSASWEVTPLQSSNPDEQRTGANSANCAIASAEAGSNLTPSFVDQARSANITPSVQ